MACCCTISAVTASANNLRRGGLGWLMHHMHALNRYHAEPDVFISSGFGCLSFLFDPPSMSSQLPTISLAAASLPGLPT